MFISKSGVTIQNFRIFGLVQGWIYAKGFQSSKISPKKNMFESLHAYMTLHIERINHEIVRLICIECYRTQRIDL